MGMLNSVFYLGGPGTGDQCSLMFVFTSFFQVESRLLVYGVGSCGHRNL